MYILSPQLYYCRAGLFLLFASLWHYPLQHQWAGHGWDGHPQEGQGGYSQGKGGLSCLLYFKLIFDRPSLTWTWCTEDTPNTWLVGRKHLKLGWTSAFFWTRWGSVFSSFPWKTFISMIWLTTRLWMSALLSHNREASIRHKNSIYIVVSMKTF